MKFEQGFSCFRKIKTGIVFSLDRVQQSVQFILETKSNLIV